MKSDSIIYRLNSTFFKLLQLGYPFLIFSLIYRLKELKGPKSPFKRKIVFNPIQKSGFVLIQITCKVHRLENLLIKVVRKRIENHVSYKLQPNLRQHFNLERRILTLITS